MLIYIIKKIFSFLLILFLLSLISVAIIHCSPNNFLHDVNFFEAYYSFYQLLFSNQLALNHLFEYSLWDILRLVLLPTFELCILAIIGAMIIGFPVGIIAGLSNNSTMNHFIKCICLILYASPIIWTSILALFLFSPHWEYIQNTHYLPSTYGFPILDILLTPNIDKLHTLLTQFKYLLLPVMILMIQPCIITIQLVSQSVANIARRNYIKVASIRENSSRKVLFRHLLPNAIPMIIPQLTYNITTLLFSTMAIEILFNRAGLGGWIFAAYHQQNYLVIAIAILSCGALISTLRLLSELLVVIIYPVQSRALYE